MPGPRKKYNQASARNEVVRVFDEEVEIDFLAPRPLPTSPGASRAHSAEGVK